MREEERKLKMTELHTQGDTTVLLWNCFLFVLSGSKYSRVYMISCMHTQSSWSHIVPTLWTLTRHFLAYPNAIYAALLLGSKLRPISANRCTTCNATYLCGISTGAAVPCLLQATDAFPVIPTHAISKISLSQYTIRIEIIRTTDTDRQGTEKSPGDQRRVAVTQTPLKDR